VGLRARLRPFLTVPGWALPCVLLLALALALMTVRTPAPRDVTAPTRLFSADRAMADVNVVGREPHPTGTRAAEVVRRHVYDRLAGMGLLVEIHGGMALRPSRRDPASAAAATVQNVVATLPGRDPLLPALAIMAHTDSVANSPGAADDGAGVAALLETARSLAADGPHRRTVLFVLTDAEEDGLLGAQAFFDRDPASRRVGMVLNMDTRGDAGRAAMFQLGPKSGALLDAYRRTAQAPFANSLTGFLFSILPNDTDYTVALEHGVPGLNFAFIGDQLAYHTPLATPAHLSRGALQSMGGQLLPVARALADAETVDEVAAPAAWFDLFGWRLLVLPWSSGAVLWLCAAGLFGVATWRALRQRLAGPWDMARGAGLAVLATLAAALALGAAGAALGSSPLRVYALVGRYESLFGGCALLALAAALTVLGLSGRRRGALAFALLALACAAAAQAGGWSLGPVLIALLAAVLGSVVLNATPRPWGTWLGAVATGLGAAFALQVWTPGAAPLVLVPTFLGALGAALVFGAGSGERTAQAALAAAGLIAAATLGWLGGWASGLFSAAGPFLPALLSVFVLLGLIVAAPFAVLWAGRPAAPWITGAVAAVAVTLLAVTGLGPPSAARPAPTILAAVQDGGATRLIAPAPRLDAWTRAALKTPVKAPLAPVYDRPVWSAPVAATPLPAPAIRAVYTEGRLILGVRPGGGGRRLTLWLRSASPLADAKLDGRPAAWAPKAGRWARLDVHAPGPDGFTLSFAAPPGVEVEAVAGELDDRTPPGAPPPPAMPPSLMPFGDSGTVLVLARVRLKPGPPPQDLGTPPA
jgi:hypothetical protein